MRTRTLPAAVRTVWLNNGSGVFTNTGQLLGDVNSATLGMAVGVHTN